MLMLRFRGDESIKESSSGLDFWRFARYEVREAGVVLCGGVGIFCEGESHATLRP